MFIQTKWLRRPLTQFKTIRASSSVHDWLFRFQCCDIKRRTAAKMARSGRTTLTTTVVTDSDEYMLAEGLDDALYRGDVSNSGVVWGS